MKKILIIVMLFLCFIVSGCGKETDKITIISPGGVPFMAIGGLLEDSELSIESVGIENLQTALSSGSHDIVIAPINLGAKLYGSGKSQYKVAAVITMNNAYIVTKASNELEGVNDLVDKEIMAFGKAGVPGGLLKFLYNTNSNLSLDLIGENWYESSVEVYGLFKDNSVAEYALMSEPEISKLKINDQINIKTLDVCKLLNIDIAPQACIFVNPNSENLNKISDVLAKIKTNIEFLNENPEEYANKILPLHQIFLDMGKEVIVSSIPLTSITYQKAYYVKGQIENILTVINPNAKIPNEDFYFEK